MKRFLPMNLQFFAEGDENHQDPQFSFDDFKAFAESNEDAQKFLKSQSQSAADKQLESWKQNNLEKIQQETIKNYEDSKKNKSPEQLKLEKLEQEFQAEKALRVTSENKAFVAEQISSLELESDIKETVSKFMLGNLVSENTEFTQNAVQGFTEVLAKLQENHQDQLKSLEMKSAFGNKQQGQQTGDQTQDQPKDPMAALNQALSQFN